MIVSLHDDATGLWEVTTLDHVKKLVTVNGALQVGLLSVVDEDGHIPVSRAVGHGANVDIVT